MNFMSKIEPKVGKSTTTKEYRLEVVERADANNRIEGLSRLLESDAVFDAYKRGEIDALEIVPRLKAQLKLG